MRELFTSIKYFTHYFDTYLVVSGQPIQHACVVGSLKVYACVSACMLMHACMRSTINWKYRIFKLFGTSIEMKSYII